MGLQGYLLSFDEPSVADDYMQYMWRCFANGRIPEDKHRFIELSREWEQFYHAAWDRLNDATTLMTAGAPHPDWDYIQHLEYELCV